MTSVFSRHGHEQVVYCQDEASGLRAIIAIYSTALGPALGGTRFYPYASEADALDDVLNLARDGIQGGDHRAGPRRGQGGHSRRPSARQERGAAAGVRPVRSRSAAATSPRATSGHTRRTWTSSRECSYVTGRSVEGGGAGDSAVLTAYGVFQGMRASAEHLWGVPTLAGRRVGVAGVGKVGIHWSRC